MHFGALWAIQHNGMAIVKGRWIEYHCRSLSIIEDGHMTMML